MAALLTLLLLSGISASFGGVINSLGSRIVNGENVTVGEMPHLVSLQYRTSNSHTCGGSIINENYVITAAHCTVDASSSDLRVVAGTINLADPKVIRMVSDIYIHELFNEDYSFMNDISLLKVDRPFEFSDTVAPIALPEPDSVLKAGKLVTVAGFGRTNLGEPVSQSMRKVLVPVMSNDECHDIYYKAMASKIYDSQICTLDSSSLHGSCKGDSGGPLTADGVLVGLVSWSGRGCASTEWPSVLTRVSKFLDWIHEHST